MRTVRRVLFAVVAATVAVPVLATLAVRLPPVQRWLAGQVSAALGPALQLQRVSPSFLPSLGLRIDGVRLVDPSDAGEGSCATARHLRAHFGLAELLDGHIEVDQLLAEDLRVTLQQAEDGSWNLVRAVGAITRRGDEDEPARPEPDTRGGRRGWASLRLPIAGRPVAVSLMARGAAEPNLTLRFESIDGALERAAPGEPLRWSFAATPGERGRIDAEGSFGGADAAGALHLAHHVEQVLAAEIFDAPPGGFETFDASLDVRGRVAPDVDWLRSMQGEGRVDLRGGRVPYGSIGGVLWSSMLDLVPGGSRLDAPQIEATVIEYLRATYRVRNGRLYTDDLAFVTDDYQVRGTGSIGYDLSLDLRLRVALTTKGATELLTARSLSPSTGRGASLPPTPFRVSGTLNSPRIVPEVHRLPLATAGSLGHGAASAAGAAVEGAGSTGRAAGESLRNALSR